MELSLVFNELSRQIAQDEDTARQWMQDFAQVAKLAAEKKILTFRSDFEFSQIELSAGYPVERWFNDQRVDEATREFIRDLTGTFQLIKPFADDLAQDDEIVLRAKDIFCQYGERDAVGLTYAYLLEGLGVSFLSDAVLWDKCQIDLVLHELPDEDADDFKTTTVQVAHSAKADHLGIHDSWITNRLRYSVGNGSVLWNKTKSWYPHLIFCKNAEKQIRELKGGTMLAAVMRRLDDLERYCSAWESGGFNGALICDSSHETLETLQAFGVERQFVCPDGKTRLFEYHLKGKVNNQPIRIHIWPDEDAQFGRSSEDQRRKILVGHIGKHLPTVNDPT